MKMLLLARAAGVDIHRLNYSPLSGPLEALASLGEGTIQVFPGDASEVRRALELHQIRVLTLFGQHRSVGILANVPTAREQGFNVSFVVWRGLYAPPGTSNAEYDRWVERIGTMSRSPEWKALLARNGLTPFYLGGRDFEKFVAEQTADYRMVSKQIGVVQ
jgi:putative tricarboxylic transport membrane protein